MTYKTFASLEAFSNCVHGFTYKNGGIATLPFGSQHMGLLSFHFQEEAWTNIKHLIQNLDLPEPIRHLVVTDQIHSDHLEAFALSDGTGAEKDGLVLHRLEGTDGVFTKDRRVLLMTFYADCTPIYFYDPVQAVAGMVHSGWKGTELKIGAKAVEFMKSTYGSKSSDLRVVIGPSAGKCCYEVDQRVYSHFAERADCFEATSPGHFKMDMKRIIALDLLDVGLLASQIEVSPDCTICQSQDYFSHRRDAGYTGRMAAFMLLK